MLTLKGHTSGVRSVAFSPDGTRIVSGSTDKTVKVWDANTGQEMLTLKGHTSGVRSVAFSSDGTRIVSGSYDVVMIWDARPVAERERPTGGREALHYRQGRANVHTTQGIRLAKLDRYKKAERTFRQAIELGEQMVRDSLVRDSSPGESTLRRSLGASRKQLVDLFTVLDRNGDAEAAYCRAVEFYGPLARDHPEVPDCCERLVSAHRSLGRFLKELGRHEDAEEAYRKAITLGEPLVRDHPGVRQYRKSLALVHNHLGVLLKKLERDQEAEQAYRKSIELYTTLVRDGPDVPEYRQELARNQMNLGLALRGLGRDKEAESAYREAIKLREQLARASPGVATYRRDLGWDRRRLIDLLTKLGRGEDTEAVYRRAVEFYESLARDHPDVPEYRTSLASAHDSLAWFLATAPERTRRRPAEAVALAQKAVEGCPEEGNYWNTLGAAQYREGSWQKAMDALQKSVELRSGGNSHDFLFLAMSHWQLGKKDEARQWYGKAVEWTEKNKPDDEELKRFRAEAEVLLGVTAE